MARLILEQIAWAYAAYKMREVGDIERIITTRSISQLKKRIPVAGELYGFEKKTHIDYCSHLEFAGPVRKCGLLEVGCPSKLGSPEFRSCEFGFSSELGSPEVRFPSELRIGESMCPERHNNGNGHPNVLKNTQSSSWSLADLFRYWMGNVPV